VALTVRNGEQFEKQITTNDGQEAVVSFVRPGNATTYSGGFVIGSTASGVFQVSVSGQPNTCLYITGARLKMTRSGVPSGFNTARIHWFTSLPSGISDGANFVVASGDIERYKGYTDLDTVVDLGQSLICQSQPLSKQILLTSGSLAFAITTTTTFTPSSGTPYRMEFDYFNV